jgi:hypothetical protein
MSVYDEYRKGVEKYISDNRETIEKTKRQANETIFPQHVLWAKEVCGELETEDAKTVWIDGEFYFTEKLVNRLMLYAFLKGERNIDIKSHKRGWEDCRKDIAGKLEFNIAGKLEFNYDDDI